MGLLIDVPVENEITQMVSLQRNFFLTGETFSLDFRIAMLKKLKNALVLHEEEFFVALKNDLNRNECETYVFEISMIYNEISFMLKNIKKFAKKKSVGLKLVFFPSRGMIFPEPYGVSLIYSPWNYPLQLSLLPLIGSIAAGNCSILRLSEISINTTKLLASIINETFPENYIKAIYEGNQLNEKLLATKVDKIFFTGSVRVGKIIMAAAANNLTPLTLELGGKSPCIVDKTANLEIAAKRIVWGKCVNSGQTCVAPDYLLIHSDVKDEFIKYAKKAVYDFYGEKQLLSDDYGIIINDRNFRRLKNLIVTQKILLGGGVDERTRKMEFTIVEETDSENKLMQEEIFGPILPLIVFDDIQKAKSIIKSKEKPLALYIFSNDKKVVNDIVKNVSFGGGCVNDNIMQAADIELPFGGVGASGTGTYHGKATFDAFTHYKAIHIAHSSIDNSIKYAPYGNKIRKLKKLI